MREASSNCPLLIAISIAALVSSDRAAVHRVIYEELVRGIVRDDSREALRGIISSLAADGAQGVILGCTELELLIGPDDVDGLPTAAELLGECPDGSTVFACGPAPMLTALRAGS